MSQPQVYLQQRQLDDWLIGHDSQEFFHLAQQTWADLQARSPRPSPLTILLAEPDPLRFLAQFTAAVAADCHICLASPTWGEREWQQAYQLVQPDLIWAANAFQPCIQRRAVSACLPATVPLILIPTGGTSGHLRFAMHTWETLLASVHGFQQFFAQSQVNACCVLPLYHVSGLMQFVRSFVTGGKLAILPFKSVEAGTLGNFDPTDYFLSLVPTQLQRLLERGDRGRWLAQFQTVLLGGAPAWADLLAQARAHHIRLAPTYGMTETAAQVATLKPDEFLSGMTGCGRVLPHAQITIRDESGTAIAADRLGRVTIQARSLALGYYPIPFAHPELQPDDLGYLDAHGYLHLVGRSSDKIITGGENVFPAEVEAAIRTTGLVADIAVLGMDDRQWGQAIVAVFIPQHPSVTVSQLQAAMSLTLSRFKHPKHWLAVTQLPRNAQGKLNQAELQALVRAHRLPSSEPTSAEVPATTPVVGAPPPRCTHGASGLH